MKASRKIPFMLGAFMAFVTGILCLVSEVDTNVAYLRIAAAMLIFYMLGALIRNTVEGIRTEIEYKQQPSENNAVDILNKPENSEASIKNGESIQNINLKAEAEAEDDEFTPLAASKYIRSKLNDK